MMMFMSLLRPLLLGLALRWPSTVDATFFPPSAQLSNPALNHDIPSDKEDNGPQRDDIKAYPNGVDSIYGVNSILLKNSKLFVDKKGRPLDIKVFPKAVDVDELANIRALIEQARLHEGDLPQRLQSFVEADPSVVAKLRGLAGGLPVAHQEEVPVIIVKGESSPPHIDFEVNMATNRRSRISHPAMFVVDTVGDAHFHYADISIPLKAGMLINFRGDMPHFTHVEKGGRVTYLGDLNLFDPVGSRHLWQDMVASELGKSRTKAVGGVKRFHNYISNINPIQRMLSEENVTETGDATTDAIVNGTVAIGNLLDKDTNEFQANFLNINIDGLPADCNDCFMKVAVADTDECTSDAHDKAMFIPLEKELTYTTDENGSTGGWDFQAFTESDADAADGATALTPTLAALLGEAASLAMSILEASTNYMVVVYMYDQDENLVACSHLQPLHEEKAAEYDALFKGLWAAVSEESGDTVESESSTSNTATPVDSTNPSLGSNTWLSAFAIVICMLVGAFLFVSV